MSTLARELFLGPAVVVDDEVFDEGTDAYAIAKQLEDEHFPVLRRSTIPADQELIHWQPMSMIVLDWDLIPKASSNDGSEDEDDGAIPLGVPIPQAARTEPGVDALGFLRKLISILYCPIFIVSNVDEDGIKHALIRGLAESDAAQLLARVMVRSKQENDRPLIEALGAWITEHPAIYALKVWQQGWESAKGDLFRDFQASSTEWPGILWRTSDEDSVNPNHALSETIARNLQHRVKPDLFDEQFILSEASAEDEASLDSVRCVLHQQAVVPAARLHDDVILPGDFFYKLPGTDTGEDSNHLPGAITICITPACDLVPRADGIDSVRMLLVRALLIPGWQRQDPDELDKLLAADNSATSLLLHHIVPEDAMYRVLLRQWHTKTWKQMRDLRRGRLLEPYITLLQQRYAQFAQRQGVPRLPKNFYAIEKSSESV